MQNTKNLILSLLLLVLLPSFASGQHPSQEVAETFHVFPMVTAGELADGSEWDGAFGVTNVDGRPTTCSLELIGMPETEFAGVGSLASLGSVAFVNLTAGRVPPGVEVGYGIITCDHAVTASFLQAFTPGEATPAEGLAMIHPTARSSVASIPLAIADEIGSTEVVAIVNDDSVDADFDVTAFDISGAFVGTTTVFIPAKTQLVEDIVTLISELPVPAGVFLAISEFPQMA